MPNWPHSHCLNCVSYPYLIIQNSYTNLKIVPNKWRHISIVIADAGVYFAVVVGPVLGRYSVTEGYSVSRHVLETESNF